MKKDELINEQKTDNIFKALDIIQYIYVDYIFKVKYKDIIESHRAKYIYKELIEEFKEIDNLLNKRHTLMAIALLRNAYEEMMYIIAISYDDSLETSVETKAGYFKDYVKENACLIFQNTITKDDIQNLYTYLSKLVHVTNLKEVASYLTSDKKCADIIIREIKMCLTTIEYMYLIYISNRTTINMELPNKLFLLLPLIEIINMIKLVNESKRKQEVLGKYIRSEKDKHYLNKKKDEATIELRSMVDMFDVQYKNKLFDLETLININGYGEVVEKILNEK